MSALQRAINLIDDESTVKEARRELFEVITALVEAEKYMKGQRAKSKAPFDPVALKRVRAALAKFDGSLTPAAPDGWKCPECGKLNGENEFCSACGYFISSRR